MLDLNEFAFFAAVVQHGGFTAAARVTGIDKARLSRHVAALEARLGVTLLRRSTRSVSLTEAGERFYTGCQAVLGSARSACDAVAELRKEPAGTIRIGSPVVLAQSFLAPLLPLYLRAHPKVTVLLEASDRPFNLMEDGLDLVLATESRGLDSTSLVARELVRMRRIIVAGRDLVGGAPPAKHPDDLAGLPAIARLSDLHDGSVRWALERADGAQVRLQLAPRLASNDLRVELEAVRGGLGVALLPTALVAEALADGSLVACLPDWFSPEFRLHLIYPLPRGVLPSVRSFRDFLLNYLSTQFAH